MRSLVFKVGDRVRIAATSAIDGSAMMREDIGNPATVIEVLTQYTPVAYRIEWDERDSWGNSGTSIYGWGLENAELEYDPKQAGDREDDV